MVKRMSVDVDNAPDHRARLVVVERAVTDLKESVGELSRTLNKWMQELSRAPRPIPFKEIVVTAAATLAVFASIISFLDSRAESATRLLQYRIEQLERTRGAAVGAPYLFALPKRNTD